MGDRRHGVHIFEINVFKLVPDEVIVRSVSVAELRKVVENVFHLRDVARRRPEQLLRVGQTLGLDFFNLLHRVLFLFTPFKALSQKI